VSDYLYVLLRMIDVSCPALPREWAASSVDRPEWQKSCAMYWYEYWQHGTVECWQHSAVC